MAETVYPRIYGVAELNYYLREYLAEDAFLSQVAVRGEISGYRAYDSGHSYFTLRDKEHSLRAVMFRRYAAHLSFTPQDGDMVVAVGGVSLYERDGSCRLYAEELIPAGEGGVSRQLAQLRRQLEAEGLFAPENKQPLPRFIFDVGVVTSPQGAAWADIQRIAYGRCPGVGLTLYPSSVQGDNAPGELAAAVAAADKGGHEVLLIARGGGAEEDLAAFDSEQVVRAVAATRTPIVSAVGHESDLSLCDLAADMRAATPTHGAALTVTPREEVLAYVEGLRQACGQAMAAYIDRAARRLERLDIQAAAAAALQRKAGQLAMDAARLSALDPLAVLARGYGLLYDEAGRPIRDSAQVLPGDEIIAYPARGKIRARVEQVSGEDIYGKTQL